MNHQRGAVNLHLVLTIFLAIGMVLFGVLAIITFRDNEDIKSTLSQRVDSAVDKAVEKQKADDAEANRKANDLPYRIYTAEAIDGGFQLQIPKSWSLVVNRNSASGSQLELQADPNAVINNMSSGAINTHAFKLQLLKKGPADTIRLYDNLVKEKKVTSRGVQVSGISATRFEGAIDQQRHNGVVIVLQVRDKTMILMTENLNYKDEFEKIVQSAKITP